FATLLLFSLAMLGSGIAGCPCYVGRWGGRTPGFGCEGGDWRIRTNIDQRREHLFSGLVVGRDREVGAELRIFEGGGRTAFAGWHFELVAGCSGGVRRGGELPLRARRLNVRRGYDGAAGVRRIEIVFEEVVVISLQLP